MRSWWSWSGTAIEKCSAPARCIFLKVMLRSEAAAQCSPPVLAPLRIPRHADGAHTPRRISWHFLDLLFIMKSTCLEGPSREELFVDGDIFTDFSFSRPHGYLLCMSSETARHASVGQRVWSTECAGALCGGAHVPAPAGGAAGHGCGICPGGGH